MGAPEVREADLILRPQFFHILADTLKHVTIVGVTTSAEWWAVLVERARPVRARILSQLLWFLFARVTYTAGTP